MEKTFWLANCWLTVIRHGKLSKSWASSIYNLNNITVTMLSVKNAATINRKPLKRVREPFDRTKGVVSFHRKQNISATSLTILPAPLLLNIPLMHWMFPFFTIYSSRMKCSQYLSQVVREPHSENDLIVGQLY